MLRLIWLLYVTSAFAEEVLENQKCGYSSCHATKDGYINVHIVPHTHDDVGWVKTVNEYYYGGPWSEGVKQILDSVFAALYVNKNRRFIYVESAFLFKWWEEQTTLTKTLFKKLVNNGQLEFVSGGWSMNDEATTNYQSIIDQFTLGLSKLNNTFGACGRPRVGWQIDPFGHSREMASILSQLGFDGLFLGRIHYQDKIQRFNTKTPEMMWQGSESLGNTSNIFTSVLYNIYDPPKGFCFDKYCGKEHFDNDNAERKWKRLVEFMRNQTNVYQTNNIILTMGGDFQYKNAEVWFSNLDRLIRYGNDQQLHGSKYHLLYSTPSCYLKAVHEEAKRSNIKWPIKTDDFFPYADKASSIWTGFYTSRPTLKRFERLGNNFLQVCSQLFVLSNSNNSYIQNLNSLKEAMGILQHHDAVSGTEKQHVANDYAKMLSEGLDNCGLIVSKAIKNLVSGKSIKSDVLNMPINSCLLSNISQCKFTEDTGSFVLTIYNPLSRPVNHYVRIPVTQGSYVVTGPRNEQPPVQLLPIPQKVLNIPGRKSGATLELVFRAVQVHPLGFKSYYVRRIKSEFLNDQNKKRVYNRKVSLRFSNRTGFLTKIIMNTKTVQVHQEFLYYKNGVYPGRPSGAYVFHPAVTNATRVAPTAKFTTHRGELVTEVHQTFNKWVSQIIRTYHDENFVEFNWLVGPLPNDDISRNVISRFTTTLNTDSTFYTDSNGREILKRIRNFNPTWKFQSTKRIRNFNPTWKFQSTLPVSENYYPVTSKILVRDAMEDVEVAILTDRCQGGSSLKDGQIELMVHRNTYSDDSLGVNENLNETAFGKPLVVRGSHYLLLGPYINQSEESLAALEKDLAQRKLLEAWTFVTSTNDLPYSEYKKSYILEYSGLNYPLPKNVQILTLEPWGINSLLLRLEHVFEKDEDPNLSKPVVVNLVGLFKPFEIISLRETTLGGNQWLNENERLKFQSGSKMEDLVDENRVGNTQIDSNGNLLFYLTENPFWRDRMKMWRQTRKTTNDANDNFYETTTIYTESKGTETEKLSITLNPMQIRTFVVDVKITNNI